MMESFNEKLELLTNIHGIHGPKRRLNTIFSEDAHIKMDTSVGLMLKRNNILNLIRDTADKNTNIVVSIKTDHLYYGTIANLLPMITLVPTPVLNDYIPVLDALETI